MDLEARKRTCERHLQNVCWEGEIGFAECPGVFKHTGFNQPKDCKIFINGKTVTVSCFHQSCAEEILSVNRVIRSELWGLPGELTKTESREYAQQASDISRMARDICSRLHEIYPRFWRGPELLAGALNAEESKEEFFKLFADHDILWIGEVYSSGVIYGPGHFRSVAHWRQAPYYWSFTCPGVFGSEGNLFRSKAQILAQPFAVIEFDKLDPDPQQNQLKSIALYFYLAETFGLRGRVAVNSGKKSIHIWCENDLQLFDEKFCFFLKMLGVDPAGLRGYQPVRMPGVIRPDTQKLQSLTVL
jgi:hypothetical protein